jgi:rhodanese-related sulfurtransferase
MAQPACRLLGVAAIALAGVVCSQPASVRTLPANELDRARASAEVPLLLDVRTTEEYEAGHIPGAVNVPVQELERRLEELRPYQDRGVITYCRSGRRAAQANEILLGGGFRDVLHLEGDFSGWAAEGRPIERSRAD